MKTRTTLRWTAVCPALLVLSAVSAASPFQPGWFTGEWGITGSVDAVECAASGRVTWRQSEKCKGHLYEKGVLTSGGAKDKSAKSSCISPAAGGKHFFPAEKIDENTFVMKGRPFLQSGSAQGTQTALSAKFFHRCNRR